MNRPRKPLQKSPYDRRWAYEHPNTKSDDPFRISIALEQQPSSHKKRMAERDFAHNVHATGISSPHKSPLIKGSFAHVPPVRAGHMARKAILMVVMIVMLVITTVFTLMLGAATLAEMRLGGSPQQAWDMFNQSQEAYYYRVLGAFK